MATGKIAAAFALSFAFLAGASGFASADEGALDLGLVQAADARATTDAAVVEKGGVVEMDNLRVVVDKPVAASRRATPGNLVLSGANESVVVRDLPDGGQFLTVMKSRAASNVHTYKFQGRTLEKLSTGHVLVRESTEMSEPIAIIEPAWAKDANGRPVPTEFLVQGEVLRQVVYVGATTAYPVVADPKFRGNWFSWALKFSRAELMKMRTNSGIIAIIGAAVPEPAISKAIATMFAAQMWVIQTALDRGRCIEVRGYGLFNVPVYVSC